MAGVKTQLADGVTLSNSGDFLTLEGVNNISEARKWYRVINELVNGGELPTTQIVGIKPLEANTNMFHKARYMRDNFADIANVLMQLHVTGFDPHIDDGYTQSIRDIVLLKIRTDNTYRNLGVSSGNPYLQKVMDTNVVTTSEVGFYRLPSTPGSVWECVPSIRFIEQDVPICRIVSAKEAPRFEIAVVLLTTSGTIDIKMARKKLSVYNKPEYNDFIYLSSRHTINPVFRILPFDTSLYNKNTQTFNIKTISVGEYSAGHFCEDLETAQSHSLFKARMAEFVMPGEDEYNGFD